MTSPTSPLPGIELLFQSHLTAAIGRQLTAQSMSVQQLAEATGIAQFALEQKLQGIGSLTVPEFVTITGQLDCKPCELAQD